MWPTSARSAPLLPSDRSHSPISRVSRRRRTIIIVSLLSAVVIIASAIRTFDLEVAFALKRPDNMSSEIPAEDIITPHDPALMDSPPVVDGPPVVDTSTPPDAAPEEPVYFSQEHLSMDEIKDMVSRTKGFFTREYSLGLGWNNVRYIIEASVLQARLLNRTLILPSFVYARSCAYEISVCADEAPMLNKGQAIGWNDWSKLPIDQQMGWQIPIFTMLNITQLRRFQPVITASEYFQYAGLPKTLETSSGYWDRSSYQQSSDPHAVHSDRTQGKPTLFVIENGWYDPDDVTRVDMIPDAIQKRGGWLAGNESAVQSGQWESRENDAAHLLLKNLLPNNKIVEWNEARSAVGQLAVQMPEVVDFNSTSQGLESDEFVEEVLNQHGFEVLYTFQGAGGMDFVKHVVIPTRQVVLRSSIRGFVEDYADIDADIVVLAGETHLFRKPGQMRFTSQSMKELFQRVVLHHVVPLDKVYDLARKLDFRISQMNGGRQWLASHVRRGDFVTVGWAWGGDSHIGHLERVMEHLDQGRKLLQSEHPYTPYSIPDITPDTTIPHRDPPEEGDLFFIATDESDPEKLRYFSEQGALMFRDLVTFDDRHEFGWGILFSDIIGLVEQATLARASYFYGSAMSSFTGGVFNMRAMLGAEEITALAD